MTEDWKPFGFDNVRFVHLLQAAAVDERGQELVRPEGRPLLALIITPHAFGTHAKEPAETHLVPWQGVASLHAQLDYWAETLPTDVRDRYDTVRRQTYEAAQESNRD
jgi:hypothetical protein